MWIKICIKVFTPLHPLAKHHYIPIAQHDVRQLAVIQMSYVLLPYLSEINTFSYNMLWLAGHHPTSGKNNKAVNVWLKDVFLL